MTKNNLILALILVLCLCVLMALATGVIKNFTAPAVTQPQKQYVELPNLNGLPISQAKAMLDAADIAYEVLYKESRVPNRVLDVEYIGKEENGIALAELGTAVKLYVNEVGMDKVIYLTFDDGPKVGYNMDYSVYYTSEELLDVLDEYGVKATFFLAGYQMVKSDRKHFVNDIFDKGHLIGCHTFSHDLDTYTDPDKIYDSVDAFISDVQIFENELKGILGEERYNSFDKYIRFPGGSSSIEYHSDYPASDFISAIQNEGYKVYDWTFLTNDADDTYRLDGESDSDYFIRSMTSGLQSAKDKGLPLILLMHDKKAMTDCLPEILEYLISEGYYFDTLDNCPEYTFAEK